MRRVAAVVVCCVVPGAALSACDNRQAFRMPEPGLERMLVQKRADPYEPSTVFPNGMVMQHPPPGTVAVDDDTDEPPPPITRELLEMGRDRFDKTCAVCHGVAGNGVSVVAEKMAFRPPPNLHEPRFRALSRERIFQVATEGFGLMSGYADLLDTRERWAVAAYVQALQLSRHAPVGELPPAIRERLERGAP